MKKCLFPLILIAILSATSCNKNPRVAKEVPQQFNNQLTSEEKAGGVMTPEIMWKFGRLGSFTLSPDGLSVLYTVTDIDLQSEAKRTNIFKLSVQGGEPVQLTSDGGSSPQWLKDGKTIAYTNKGNLFTMNADGSNQKAITGISDFEIFSISPSGDKIYFTKRVKLDQTANEKHNLPKANVRIINDLMYRHWNYWGDYSYSHIFVASFNGNEISGEKDIMEGQRFESPTAPYFDEGEIAWSPDGNSIAYTTKRLNGKADAVSTNSDIYLYDTETGKEINITEGNKGYDRYPVFSPDGSKIAYQSMERDGYESDLDRLFVYDIKDGTGTWITRSWDFDVSNIVWNDNETLYFACSHLGTSQIFRTDLKGKEIFKVTEGIHNLGPFNIKSGVLVSQLTSMSMAPEISVVNMTTGAVKQISFINKAIYESIKMGKVEEKYTKTKDKKDLQMWVIYPPDFNPAKKYPALLFCEGGPQSALDQFWSYRWNMQMIAAKGYIVFAPNRRGVSGFGLEWKEQISGDYGGKNIQDYLDATDAMAKEPYVDAQKMGAVGASYGGFSIFYLAGVHQNRFKAFIAHCGVFNFVSEYGSTEEVWFPNKDYGGAYWNDLPSYKFSPHLMVNKWTTPILIITGANDFRIPYTQSLEAFQAAQLHGVPSRLLFFEDECHWVTKPQNAVIWQREFFEWLDTYLK
ncbi:MAG TPA: S9 family peptidase [Bacteroidales bacterium]|nr:S9 family peptidase [Bacteroidales bacterium]HPT21057.1 S9 family peptidase [Bacteroidales bacterium]